MIIFSFLLFIFGHGSSIFSRMKTRGEEGCRCCIENPSLIHSPYKCGTTAHMELFENVRLNLGFIITGQSPLGWVPSFWGTNPAHKPSNSGALLFSLSSPSVFHLNNKKRLAFFCVFFFFSAESLPNLRTVVILIPDLLYRSFHLVPSEGWIRVFMCAFRLTLYCQGHPKGEEKVRVVSCVLPWIKVIHRGICIYPHLPFVVHLRRAYFAEHNFFLNWGAAFGPHPQPFLTSFVSNRKFHGRELTAQALFYFFYFYFLWPSHVAWRYITTGRLN